MDANIVPSKAMPVQEMDVYTDTRDYLAPARRDAREMGCLLTGSSAISTRITWKLCIGTR